MNERLIVRHGHINAFYNDSLEVNWSLTDMCNYNCSYCFFHDSEKKKLNRSRFTTLEQLKNAVDNIASLKRSKYSIVLSGGEPTVHPHFAEILKYISLKIDNSALEIVVITNGSRLPSIYQDIYDIGKRVPVKFIISLHSDHVKMSQIVNIVEKYSSFVAIAFSLMFNPEKRIFVKEIHEKLISMRKQYSFSLRVVTLREPPRFDSVDTRYTKEDLAWQDAANSEFGIAAKNSPIPLLPQMKLAVIRSFWHLREENCHIFKKDIQRDLALKNGLLGFKGMYCSLGTNVLSVHSNGKCKGAHCGIAPVSPQTLFEKNPYENEEFISIVKCTLQNCGCATNDQILKFTDQQEAEQFIAHFKRLQRAQLTGVGVSGSSDTRIHWINSLERVARPVLTALAQQELRQRIPLHTDCKSRELILTLEAPARILAGIAPWLALKYISPGEKVVQQEYAYLARVAIDSVTDPVSKDYADVNKKHATTTLVNAALLSQAICRAPDELWHRLDTRVQKNLVSILEAAKKQFSGEATLLPFAAMIEIALSIAGANADRDIVNGALRQADNWNMNNVKFNMSVQNSGFCSSLVVLPMFLDIAEYAGKHISGVKSLQKKIYKQAVDSLDKVSPKLFAALDDRNSITELAYHYGVFQLPAQMALKQRLPRRLSPSWVHDQLTAMILRTTAQHADIFTNDGWFNPGLHSHQDFGEKNFSTVGSLYLWTTCLLPLGLPESDPFWTINKISTDSPKPNTFRYWKRWLSSLGNYKRGTTGSKPELV